MLIEDYYKYDLKMTRNYFITEITLSQITDNFNYYYDFKRKELIC